MIRSVLIVGGSGFVGTHLAIRLREGYRVYATYHGRRLQIPGVSMLPLNIDNRNLLKRIVGISRPDVVVYLAGAPPSANSKKDALSMDKLHVEGPSNLLTVAEMLHPRFIYLSHALVFDGSRGNYHESDAALPNTILGRAKVSGENFIRGRFAHSIVIRSSPVFGRGNPYHHSLFDQVRLRLDRGQPIELNDYHVHSFAPVNGLVDLMEEVIARPALKSRVLHYGGLTKATAAGLSRIFASRQGYDPKLIIPKASQITAAAVRAAGRDVGMLHPGDFSLNSTATIEALKIKPFLLEEGFDLIEKDLVTAS